jgi:amidase
MDIVFSSTTQLAAAIGAKKLSAVEALEAHLAQIARRNRLLNAVIAIAADTALERAREADDALRRGEVRGPLHGVPFTLKDAHETAGLKTTAGFPPLANHVPAEDSTVAARLKDAGAILVGKTNVAMLLADHQSSNPLYGRTSNPWDPERTAGGSSGGAAAALAAGMTPFEIGTDLSSSIRVPAHFCGVYGLKPTETRVPLDGGFPNPQKAPRTIRIMLSIGPMARTVEDLSLLYRVIAGPGGKDTDVGPVPVEPAMRCDPAGLRIAFAPTFPGLPVAADIAAAVSRLAAKLAGTGAAIEEAALPKLDFREDLQCAGELIGMMIGAAQPDSSDRPATLAAYCAALARRDRSILAWEDFFAQYDALICPASATTAFRHCEPGTPIELDGKKADYGLIGAHGTVFNYSGHPAVVVPCGQDGQGLPIGLQLVGKRWSEARLIGIAALVEQHVGGFQRPPGY